MRTTTILCACLALCSLAGCDYNAETVMNQDMPEQNKLSIIAPNGEQIAESLEALQANTAMNIAKQFGRNHNFTITSIEYAPLDEGYLALVNYRLENGLTSNYALSSNREILVDSPVNVTIYPQESGILLEDENGEVLVATTRREASTDSCLLKRR